MVDLVVDLVVDLAVIAVLAFGLYYRRHGRRDLCLAFVALNVGLFTVVATLSRAHGAGIALGFGLFGVLSIIRLRSASVQQEEAGYRVRPDGRHVRGRPGRMRRPGGRRERGGRLGRGRRRGAAGGWCAAGGGHRARLTGPGPVLTTSYRRTTFADPGAGLRVTCDTGLTVTVPGGPELCAAPDLVIVEVKSATPRGWRWSASCATAVSAR